jgi:polyphosphate glucokinase
MSESTPWRDTAILSVDIGATSIKFCPVANDGVLLADVERIETPYPCWPLTLVDVVSAVINDSGLTRAAVGFPGDMVEGRVSEPGNLSRPGGISTPIDQDINAQWLGFSLQEELQSRCRAIVRVVNDATLAAHGYANGVGRELIFTLGTGLGIALVVDAMSVKIRDVGSATFHGLGTYDEVFGEPSRARDMTLWRRRLSEAIGEFVIEFCADSVHVGGGNARHLRAQDLMDVGCPVDFNDNDGTLRGGAFLFATA